MRAYGESGYDHDDHEQYVKDCGRAVTILESAIENIEMDLVPEAPDELQPRTKKTGGSKFGGVSIAQVGTAVMGDKNIFAKIDSINVFDFLKILEKEVQEKVQDPPTKNHATAESQRHLSKPRYEHDTGGRRSVKSLEA